MVEAPNRISLLFEQCAGGADRRRFANAVSASDDKEQGRFGRRHAALLDPSRAPGMRPASSHGGANRCRCRAICYPSFRLK